MKLCVPTETDRGMDAVTAAHFGTAPYFTMVDLENDTVTIVRNPACGHAPGACHHLDILRAHEVDVVASSGIGRRAFTALDEAGIRVVPAPSPASRYPCRSARPAPATITVPDTGTAIGTGTGTPDPFGSACPVLGSDATAASTPAIGCSSRAASRCARWRRSGSNSTSSRPCGSAMPRS